MHIYDLFEAANLHSRRAGDDVFQLCLREDKANVKKIPALLDCSEKKDGLFIMAHRGVLFARSGQCVTNQALLNIPPNIKWLMDEMPNHMFQFEMKSTKLRNTVFNGAISPVRKKPLELEIAQELRHHQMWLTDAISRAGFVNGGEPRQQRRELMNHAASEFELLIPEFRMLSHADMLLWAEEIIADGDEGAVGYNPTGYYTAGARRADLAIKKAKEVSFDLRCVRVRPGKTGKRLGMAEGFDMQYGDKVIKADLGIDWSDEKRIEVLRNPSEAVGHIFRVYAFDKSELGVLRQPKVAERRDDKHIPDEVE